MASQLIVGAARVKIEIPESFFPYRSFRNRCFTAIHDDLYARTVLIENDDTRIAFLAIELADLGQVPLWQERVSQVSGIAPDHIFITVPHNHLAPHVSDDWNEDVIDKEKTAWFGELVWEAVKQSVETALAERQPARVGFGTGTCDININRDYLPRPHSLVDHNPHGLSDKTVGVVRFSDLKGEPIAFLINYAVHGSVMMNVFMEDGGMHVSGDLPGATSRLVEGAYEKPPVALWTSGAAADQNPKYMVFPDPTGGPGGPPDFAHFVSPGEAGFLVVEMQAKSLADEVLWVSDCMDHDEAQADLACRQRTVTMEGQKKAPPRSQGNLSYEFEEAEPVSMSLGLLRINDILISTVPGEIVTSIGLAVKAALSRRSRKTMVVTHCNGSFSYMSDAVGFANRSGEAVRSHIGSGEAEYKIVATVVKLAAETDPA